MIYFINFENILGRQLYYVFVIEMANEEHGEGSNCRTNNSETERGPASTVGAIEPTVSMEAFMQMMTNMSQIFNKGAHSASEPETDASWPGRWMDVFLRANPLRFSGTTNPLEAVNWLRKIQKIFAAMECPEERKVSLVELLLENDSESWWENHNGPFGSRVLVLKNWNSVKPKTSRFWFS